MGFYSRVPWWVRGGCVSLVIGAAWLGSLLAMCESPGRVCEDAGAILRGLNAPYNVVADPVFRALARAMGLNSHLLFQSPNPQPHEGWILAIVVLGMVLYWFAIGAAVAWSLRFVGRFLALVPPKG